MPQGPNPYYARGSQTGAALAQGVSNLGQAFLGGADPRRRAETLRDAWGARLDSEKVTDLTQARTGRNQLGDLFGGYTPETGFTPTVQRALSAGLSSGALDPDQLGTLFRVASGNLPGVSDTLRAGAAFGSGEFIGQEDAVSLQDREGIRSRIQGNELARQQLEEDAAMARLQYEQQTPGMPSSRDETIAQIFLNQGPSAAETAASAMYPDRGSVDPWQRADRQADLQTGLADEVALQLAAGGVPTDEEGNLREDLLPPGAFASVLDTAWNQMQRDVEAGGAVKSRSAYVSDALREAGFGQGFEYTEDTIPIWGLGEERLTPRPAPRAPSMQGQQPQGGGPIPGQTTFTDPDTGVTYRFRGGNPNDQSSWEPMS